MFNDIKNKDKNKDEKKEEKIKNNYIKCTDCELIYDTIEEMSKHYFSFHDKNRKNEKLENNNKNDINSYINQILIIWLKKGMKKLLMFYKQKNYLFDF